MFIGHYAVGFAAKKTAPGISLGWLFIAVQFLDLIWPTLLLLNVEQVEINPDPNQLTPLTFTNYPVSHSLLMAVIWAFLFGMIYWLIRKNLKIAIVLSLCVLSHWVLDFIVHYPDLPIYPGSPSKVGLRVWSLPVLENFIEAIMFLAGVVIYLRTTAAKNKLGKYLTIILIVLLIAAYLGNIFGPDPSNVKTLAWAAQMMWLFVLMAFWTDHNRRLITMDPVL